MTFLAHVVYTLLFFLSSGRLLREQFGSRLRALSWVKKRGSGWAELAGRLQNSMPTPLVYNGPVRITAGAWRAERGTQHSLVCLFYKPLPCSACKVPVGFVWFNSRSIQTVHSVSTMAVNLWPQRTCVKELCQNKLAMTLQFIC